MWVVVLFLLFAGRAHADAMSQGPSAMPWSADALMADATVPRAAQDIVPEQTGAMLLAASTGTAVTPEPSSVVLMGSGMVGFGGMLWRRRRLTREGKR